jgi:hypothetical protein
MDNRDELTKPLGALGLGALILTPGTPIAVMIHPLRDGSNGGQFLTATFSDGRQMDGGRPVTNQTRCNRCAIKPLRLTVT